MSEGKRDSHFTKACNQRGRSAGVSRLFLGDHFFYQTAIDDQVLAGDEAGKNLNMKIYLFFYRLMETARQGASLSRSSGQNSLAPKNKPCIYGKPHQEMKDEKQSAAALGKTLAIATMAASLGMSLGVPVGDVLAADEKLDNPSAISHQDKHTMASKQLKISPQSKLSGQVKLSTQSKLPEQSRVSNQFKFSNQSKLSKQGKVESSQLKIDSSKATGGSSAAR